MSGFHKFFMSHGISTRSERIPLLKKKKKKSKESSCLSWISVQARKNPTPPHSSCSFSFPVFWVKSSPEKPKLAKFVGISQIVLLWTLSFYRFSAGMVEKRNHTKGFGESSLSRNPAPHWVSVNPLGEEVSHMLQLSENLQSSSFIPGQKVQHWTTKNCGHCGWKMAWIVNVNWQQIIWCMYVWVNAPLRTFKLSSRSLLIARCNWYRVVFNFGSEQK